MARTAKTTSSRRGATKASIGASPSPSSQRRRDATATATATESARKMRTRAAKPAASPRGGPTPTQAGGEGGRFAAPDVQLGMMPPDVRAVAGQPECIVFGSDDHVEWQFVRRGVDPVGAPILYVTALTFKTGRVIQITERTAEAP